ncbi:MBL fold metallo-hydrolase [Acidithiobacillus sp. M4-SHS-6]|uniref:MBL fold metallo-hydrolase n=1 Tax=Acidithiobacillus sp. M4-SHS-6 TaxID=3383024 RepID=UPI0039BE31F7
MIFRQLFEPESSTYTYLFGCEDTGLVVLLDPVIDTVERDLILLHELGLRLAYTLETHIHADHLSAARKLKHLVASKIAGPAMDELPCTDFGVSEDRPLAVGSLAFKPLFTPGHTDTHHSYLIGDGATKRVFTGDALLIDGCGRTDFQSGDAATLYRSIHEKIFTLPDDTLVYPAHDYNHHHVSTVAQERERNLRLGAGKTLADFVQIMANLNLPYPKKMDFAVPGNRKCGECPEETPEALRKLCNLSEQG